MFLIHTRHSLSAVTGFRIRGIGSHWRNLLELSQTEYTDLPSSWWLMREFTGRPGHPTNSSSLPRPIILLSEPIRPNMYESALFSSSLRCRANSRAVLVFLERLVRCQLGSSLVTRRIEVRTGSRSTKFRCDWWDGTMSPRSGIPRQS